MTTVGRASFTAEQRHVLERASTRYQQGRLTDQEFLGLLVDAGISAFQANLALKQLRELTESVGPRAG